MSFEGGYQSDIILASTTVQGGAIFITDIIPQDANENVAAKVFSSDGLVLQSCSSSTDLIRLSVLAITGFSTFKPIVMVENQLVNLLQDEDQNVWTGTIDIDLQGKSFVEAIHNDGAFHRCLITDEATPIITAANFVGGYPQGQSELKEDDLFTLFVEGSGAFVAIEVDGFGAAKGETFQVAESSTAQINLSIANQGNIATSYGVRLRIVNSNGTKSDWYSTEKPNSVDGVDTVILNNLKPTISIQSINYPENQFAIKNEEIATVQHTVSNYDSLVYSSPSGQLQITEPTSYSASKEITRISGDYNTTQHNLRIVAHRSANGSSVELNEVIKIANTAAVISFENNEGRLVSGGNNNTPIQTHKLAIQSNQELINPPQITIAHGLLDGGATKVGKTNNFEQVILIHDDDTKGLHQANLVQAVNLAGIVTTAFTGVANYTIGGFVKRVLPFAEFNKESAIGTKVSDVQKLVAKDSNEILLSYVPNMDNLRLTYTITEPSNTLNPNGGIFHWNDEEAVNNNSTGLATILLEELP